MYQTQWISIVKQCSKDSLKVAKFDHQLGKLLKKFEDFIDELYDEIPVSDKNLKKAEKDHA